MRNFFIRIAALAATALMVISCGSSSDSSANMASVRVLHAVSDAPRVNVYLDDELVLNDVDFRAGSGYLPIMSGAYDVRVEAIVPGGNIDVITIDDFDFSAGSASTLVATGDVSEASIAPLPIAEPTEAIAPGNIRLRVTHASPEAPPVYLAITTPDLPIDQAALLGPFSYQQTTDALEVPAGNYQVRVTASGQPLVDDDVLFDTGELPLAEGADLHVFAVTSTVPSTNAAGSPISLVVLDGSGSSDIFDADTGANLRVVHNSPGAPAVDVVVDLNDTMVDEDLEIVTGLAYGESAGYLSPAVAAFSYNVGVRASPDGVDDVLNFDADLMAGMGYTVIANDVFPGSITQWVLVDDYRPVVTEAKVRLAHGSPSAGIVDIYVFSSADNLLPEDVAGPALESVAFGTATGFLSLAPGDYDIYVTGENSIVPAISVTGLTVNAGGVYTAIARDPDPLDAMDTMLGVTLIADEL